MGEVEFHRLGPDDAGQVLTVQRAAFVAEARLYGTVDIPPLLDTLDDIRREIDTTVTIGGVLGGRLIAAARLTVDGTVGWISRVAVAPDQQGLGVGSRLLAAVEGAAPETVRRFQLAAGAKSEGNMALYARRGYQEFARMTDSVGIELVCMGKDRSG